MRILVLVLTTAFAAIFTSAAMIKSDFDAVNSYSLELPGSGPLSENTFVNKRMDGIEENLEVVLSKLTNDMMCHVQPLLFNFQRYEQNSREYVSLLSDIDLKIKQLSPPRQDLLRKLKFTHRILNEMNEAFMYGKLFSRREGTDYCIAINMIQLNLSLLSFLDEFGEPTYSLPVWFLRAGTTHGSKVQYGNYLHSFAGTSEDWQLSFGKSGPVSPPVRALFNQQVQKSKHTLEFLASVLTDGNV